MHNKMTTYTQILYQIIFGTYQRKKTLSPDNRDELYKFITGILRNKKCLLYQIGGIEDHIHIVIYLHPSIALAGLVKTIKLASTDYIKTNKLFPLFEGWQKGYGAFTYSLESKRNLINYVKNQVEHHKKKDFVEEYKELLHENEILFDEKYLL